MVPDKFNMVDMEGIDIIESQGLAVPGLYQKLVDSTVLCRYQCLYNWKFDGISIPPTYVEMDVVDDVVWINEGVSVDEDDVIRVYSLEPPPVEPVIESLSVTENGTYLAPEGVDGFNPVSVQVPEPVFEIINITENGTYQPSQGVDGFSSVTVDIPTGSLNIAVISSSSNFNSTYSADKAFTGGFWGAQGSSQEWIAMAFQAPVALTKISFGNTNVVGVSHWSSTRVIFQASNDNSSWIDLYDAQNLTDDPNNRYTFTFTNGNAYSYYRFLCYKGQFYAGLGYITVL